jgi:hypothetical protein
VIALSAAALVAAGCMAAFDSRVVPNRGAAKQLRLLEVYDLTGAIRLNPELRLPELERTYPSLLDAMRAAAGKLYSPIRSDTLARSAQLQASLMQAPDNVLHRPWLNLLLHYPQLYLQERVQVFRWVLLTPDLRPCVPYVVGLRGPPEVLAELNMKERFGWRDELVDAYGRTFMGTPAFSHLTYLVLAVFELAFLVRRRRVTDVVFAMLLLGSVAFCASFFFVSIACDYRYLYLLDMAGLVTLFYLAVAPRIGKERI